MGIAGATQKPDHSGRQLQNSQRSTKSEGRSNMKELSCAECWKCQMVFSSNYSHFAQNLAVNKLRSFCFGSFCFSGNRVLSLANLAFQSNNWFLEVIYKLLLGCSQTCVTIRKCWRRCSVPFGERRPQEKQKQTLTKVGKCSFFPLVVSPKKPSFQRPAHDGSCSHGQSWLAANWTNIDVCKFFLGRIADATLSLPALKSSSTHQELNSDYRNWNIQNKRF